MNLDLLSLSLSLSQKYQQQASDLQEKVKRFEKENESLSKELYAAQNTDLQYTTVSLPHELFIIQTLQIAFAAQMSPVLTDLLLKFMFVIISSLVFLKIFFKFIPYSC